MQSRVGSVGCVVWGLNGSIRSDGITYRGRVILTYTGPFYPTCCSAVLVAQLVYPLWSDLTYFGLYGIL